MIFKLVSFLHLLFYKTEIATLCCRCIRWKFALCRFGSQTKYI